MSMLARKCRHREESKRRGDPENLVAAELDCFVAVLLAMTIAHLSSRADVDRLQEWAGRIDIMGLSDFTSRA